MRTFLPPRADVLADVTRILSDIRKGDQVAAEELLPLVYEELRKLAAARMVREKPGQTLHPTALVHEAYLRLVDVENPQKRTPTAKNTHQPSENVNSGTTFWRRGEQGRRGARSPREFAHCKVAWNGRVSGYAEEPGCHCQPSFRDRQGARAGIVQNVPIVADFHARTQSFSLLRGCPSPSTEVRS